MEFKVADTVIWELLASNVIVAGTKAVVLYRLSMYEQSTALGYQCIVFPPKPGKLAGNDHVVVGPKTEVMMSGISGPGAQVQ